MASAPSLTDDLLAPISADRPAGEPFQYTDAYYEIKNARKSDRPEDAGGFERLDGFKVADFEQVRELCERALREKSKDLQTAIWLTEANVRTRGFAGLRDSFALLRELLERYWETLFPELAEGLEARTLTLEWLNEKLAEEVRQIPLTAPIDANEPGLAYFHYSDSRIVGSRADCVKANGDVDETRLATYKKQVEQDGRTSAEAWQGAVSKTPSSFFEQLADELEQVLQEHEALSRTSENRFGPESAPALSLGKQALEECRDVVRKILVVNRRNEESEGTDGSQDVGVEAAANAAPSHTSSQLWHGGEAASAGAASQNDWQAAQEMVRQGRIDAGLAEMRRLAARETTGRARFQRKLFLAEVCLSTKRMRLARLILEELNEQIEKLQLQDWEGAELVGRVWSKLYETHCAEGGDRSKAEQLYQRLCRLDPWQAYACDEQ